MNNSQETEGRPTLGSLRRLLARRLAPVWADEAQPIARALLEEEFSMDLTGLVLNAARPVTPAEEASLEEKVGRLMRGDPLQYVVGHASFCGLEIGVRGGVLIPRPETEQLVSWVAQELRGDSPSVLDIGTGSGCIALALKSIASRATVVGLDKSDEALALARENALRLGLDVDFRKADILSPAPPEAGRAYDVVVSNPPYVCIKEKKDMASHVVDHEPHMALFVPDDDPLLFYRAIASKCAEGLLRKGGRLFFELNEAYGAETARMLSSMGFGGVELRDDFAGRSRMARALLG